jgi:hypothetical protein
VAENRIEEGIGKSGDEHGDAGEGGVELEVGNVDHQTKRIDRVDNVIIGEAAETPVYTHAQGHFLGSGNGRLWAESC